ncbi:MAG TPA: GAP family protein [Mycobacterium sp.]|nr:GAP family protein [Mycobacterium sp.]
MIVAVLMSRLRPKHNLLAYWLGGLAAGVVPGIGVFALALALHDSLPPAMDHARSTAARFTGGYFQIAIGAVALLIAAMVSARPPARQQAFPSGWGVQPIGPTAIARVWARVGRALQGGNPWVAFGIGLVSTMPPIDYLLVLIVIVSSGTAFGTQLGAVVMFTLVVLVLVEIPLVSYLVMPAKTEAAVLQLRRLALVHRRRILIAVPAVAGVVLIATGIGSI